MRARYEWFWNKIRESHFVPEPFTPLWRGFAARAANAGGNPENQTHSEKREAGGEVMVAMIAVRLSCSSRTAVKDKQEAAHGR